MVITSTEFQNNFTKYINMLINEDIFLTLDGKTIAKIIYPKHSEVDKISGLLEGKLLDGYNSKDLRMEHLKKNDYSFDD